MKKYRVVRDGDKFIPEHFHEKSEDWCVFANIRSGFNSVKFDTQEEAIAMCEEQIEKDKNRIVWESTKKDLK